MSIVKEIFKIILLLIAVLSLPATGLFGTMAFQALTTQNVGAVLVGAIFLGYFLIATAINLILLLWISFWNIHRLWNLLLGLEVSGFILFIAFSLPISKITDYRTLLILSVLALIYGLLAIAFMRRAYMQFSHRHKQV